MEDKTLKQVYDIRMAVYKLEQDKAAVAQYSRVINSFLLHLSQKIINLEGEERELIGANLKDKVPTLKDAEIDNRIERLAYDTGLIKALEFFKKSKK